MKIIIIMMINKMNSPLILTLFLFYLNPRILEVDYDATEELIRSNYIRLALKWHPDKKKDEDGATSKFQEINEAYQVLIDPVKRQEYDTKGMMHFDYNITEYLNRHKGLILTCNGLGMKYSMW